MTEPYLGMPTREEWVNAGQEIVRLTGLVAQARTAALTEAAAIVADSAAEYEKQAGGSVSGVVHDAMLMTGDALELVGDAIKERIGTPSLDHTAADRLADKIEDLIAEFGDDPKAALECVSEHLSLRRHAKTVAPSDQMAGIEQCAKIADRFAANNKGSSNPQAFAAFTVATEIARAIRKAAPAPSMVEGDDLRKRVMRAIFDPGATEGFKGDRDLTTWQTDAVMRVLATERQS